MCLIKLKLCMIGCTLYHQMPSTHRGKRCCTKNEFMSASFDSRMVKDPGFHATPHYHHLTFVTSEIMER